MSDADIVRFGAFRLDRTQKMLFRDDEAVALTPKAFEMLDFLVRNAGRVVEKDALMRGVWPDTFVDEANLAHHIFTLRRALGDDREGNRFIETIPRRGYRFVAELGDQVIEERIQQRVVIEEQIPRRSYLVPLLLLITAASLVPLVFLFRRGKPPVETPKSIRVSISPPPNGRFPQNPVTCDLAVSPDGRMLVMVVLEGQRRKLFVREFDKLGARPIAGSDDGTAPFWSPDGKWIGFFSGGSMKKVPLDGGPVQTICPAQGGMASWHENGQIVFDEWGPGQSEAVRLVHESGGKPRDITDENKGWGTWPSFLPDGKHYVFFWLRPDKRGIYIGSIEGGEPAFVLPVSSHAEVRNEDLYYVREGVLVRHRLDMKRFKVIGDPSPIASSVFCYSSIGSANFGLSKDASVIAWQRRTLATQLVWRDWNGREIARVGKPDLYRKFQISPDGRRLAADVAEAATEIPAVWVFDLERGVGTRVASNSWTVTSPIWTPDGNQLVIGVADPAHLTKPPVPSLLNLADGSIRDLRDSGGVEYATDITRDGSRIFVTVNRGRYSEVELLPVANPKAKIPIEGNRDYDMADAVLSPDDRWIAYQSSESGRPEIYFRPFDRNGEKVRVSTGGGSEPQWTVDGKAILFLSPEGMLMKADVAGSAIKESVLFPISSAGMMAMTSLGQSHYAVTRDRILTREIPGGADADPVTVLFTPPPGR